MEVPEKLYPTLPQPTAPNLYVELPDINDMHAVNKYSSNYRMNKISEIQKQIELEREKRSSLAKKYKKGVNVLNGISGTLEFASIGLGTAGLSVLSTIVAAPIAIIMEGVAIGLGVTSLILHAVSDKYLIKKVNKHSKIEIEAMTKLNTISDHVSKALNDGRISEEEYSLIVSELDKFNQMKEEVKTKTKIDTDTRNLLINQGKEEVINQFKSLFGDKNSI